MKKLLVILAAMAALSCNKTESNDPWGKMEVDPNAKKGTVVKDETVTSSKRGETMKYSVWLPDGYDASKTYPFLYLLHGMGDDNNSWTNEKEKGKAASILNAYQTEGGVPMVVIMPDAKVSFYVNLEGEIRDFLDKPGHFEDYFFDELVPAAEAKYKCNGKRAVAGLSMGGWGTLYYSLSRPGFFTYGYAMSPATGLSWFDISLEDIIKEKDVSKLPMITLESGTEDESVGIASVDACDQLLSKYNVKHNYIRRKGKHDWPFWNECLPKALKVIGDTFQHFVQIEKHLNK